MANRIQRTVLSVIMLPLPALLPAAEQDESALIDPRIERRQIRESQIDR